MKSIVILYSKYLPNQINYQQVAKILQTAQIETDLVAVEDLIDAFELSTYKVLINGLGQYYYEENVDVLIKFYQQGGSLINIGTEPFTRPYELREEVLKYGIHNINVLRDIGIIDEYAEIDIDAENHKTFVLLDDKYKALEREDMNLNIVSVYSGLYNLSEKVEGHEKYEKRINLEPILGMYNENKELVAVPIIKAVHFNKGSMIYFNFTLEDKDYFSHKGLRELLLKIIKDTLIGNINLNFETKYARYQPTEEVVLNVEIEELNKNQLRRFKVEIQVSKIENATQTLIYKEKLNIEKEQKSIQVVIGILEEGQYQANISVKVDDEMIACKHTGFYVVSNEQILAQMKENSRIQIDKNQSTDFCIKDDAIYPIHGTTYFVTDRYRECFLHFNLAVCEEDLRRLQKDGFNILRSGNWKLALAFYRDNGEIEEKALRALQAFFLCALKYDFTVQFVLGVVALNDWNRELCAIHNEEILEKSSTLIKTFAIAFGEYTNVMLDLVNEPSYSYGGAWTLGRPSRDEYELKNFIQWLKNKYGNDISKLRSAWGETAYNVKTFEEIYLPEEEHFERGWFRTEKYIKTCIITDFFQFARESYSKWLKNIREIAHQHAPKMVVIMGRDESLRIPCEQDEVLQNNIDMVCWHQWNYTAAVYTEYLLNRTRGYVCCAQELGVYRLEGIRGGKRHTDLEVSRMLEKKLLCSFGNWIQWQAFNDPYMHELSENTLGLYRADKTPTASLKVCRALAQVEQEMAMFMKHREEDQIRILSLYGTSYYFSVESELAEQGIRKHVAVLNNYMKQQSNIVLEHLFIEKNQEMIGKPQLIIMPCMQMIKQNIWENILDYIRKGGVVLITGTIEKDEFFRAKKRIGKFNSKLATEKLLDFEKITIKDKNFMINFCQNVGYGDASHLLDKDVYEEDKDIHEDKDRMQLQEYSIGNGTLLHCPIPVELSDSIEAIKAVYQVAIERAGASNSLYRTEDSKPNIFIHAIPYEKCTLYTVLNEGEADSISIYDLQSGQKVQLQLLKRQGIKIWIDHKGKILNKYSI